MLANCTSVLRKQAIKETTNPDYNVYKDVEYCQNTRDTVEMFLIKPLNLSKHETVNLMLLIFYGYPETSDVCWPDQKLPKDSLNRLFILLERYNKLIKQKSDLNLKQILRRIVLKEVVEPLVEYDVEQIPLTE
jgi:hypothetical protein